MAMAVDIVHGVFRCTVCWARFFSQAAADEHVRTHRPRAAVKPASAYERAEMKRNAMRVLRQQRRGLYGQNVLRAGELAQGVSTGDGDMPPPVAVVDRSLPVGHPWRVIRVLSKFQYAIAAESSSRRGAPSPGGSGGARAEGGYHCVFDFCNARLASSHLLHYHVMQSEHHAPHRCAWARAPRRA